MRLMVLREEHVQPRILVEATTRLTPHQRPDGTNEVYEASLDTNVLCPLVVGLRVWLRVTGLLSLGLG